MLLLHLLEIYCYPLADIDECLDNNGFCGDICVNTDGSFMCQCSSGRVLSTDNRTCEGFKYIIFV